MHIERRVVVTGAAGFIGSHLCEHLLAKGCHVLCVDNFFSGTKQNIEHLLDNSHFEVLRLDVTVPLYVEPTRSITWRVLPRRSITSATRCKPPRRACMAQSTCSALASDSGQNSSGVDVGNLRRPTNPPAAGILLGKRQPDRSALMLQ